MTIDDFSSLSATPQPVGPLGPAGPRPPITVGPQSGPTFGEVLEQKGKEVKLSAHAQARLKSRNIPWDATRQERLNSLVEKAAAKGARESLVLMEDVAFIVSVRNRTVITAVDGQNIKENVFTNIDSAVIG
jgi:flagellar operon protein